MNCQKNIIKLQIKSAIFDSEDVYNGKYLQTKIKSQEGKVNPNFHNEKIPKESSHCILLQMILTISVLEMGKNYYPQKCLEEWEYIVKEKK